MTFSRPHIRLLLAASLLGALCVMPAQAEEGACTGPVAVGEDMGGLMLARVAQGRVRVSFVRSRDKAAPLCPSVLAECRAKAFVVAGDEVIVRRGAGPFVCGLYKSAKGAETAGWLPASDLEMVERRPDTKPDEWAGDWRRDQEGEIRIARKGSGVVVSGSATYGAMDPDRVRRGAINIGELDGAATLAGDRILIGAGYNGAKAPEQIEPTDCVARLHLLGRYVVAEDNSGCGGMNVRFTGVYLRVVK
jgi:hypothetical protein